MDKFLSLREAYICPSPNSLKKKRMTSALT